MEKKSLSNRYADEVLSDNTDQYSQCKDCLFRDMINHKKGVCDIYQLKPTSVRKNTENCEYYEKE